jgi:hypothetical protein
MGRALALICLAFGLMACSKGGDSCEGKPFCKDFGWCGKNGEGGCKARNDDDCKQSAACRMNGYCKEFDGKCGPTSQADCDSAQTCDGNTKEAAPPAAPAAPGQAAQTWPACRFNEKRHRCEDVDCYASGMCQHGGVVTSVEDVGTATHPELEATYGDEARPGDPADCKDSLACVREGNCSISADGKQCVPGADADCAGSDRWCKAEGKCAFSDGQCVVKDDAGCRASVACTGEGRCYAENGACVAKDDADCKKSSGCTGSGACTLIDGYQGKVCVAQTSDDCTKSTGCKDSGTCKYDHNRCVITTAGCKASTRCKTEGACFAQTWDNCVGSDKTCAASDACKNEGRCRWDGGAYGLCSK